MKYVYSHDNNNHTYTTTIKTKNKEYIGTVVCRKEDYDFETVQVGRQLSTAKAMIKMWKDELSVLRIKYEQVYHIFNIMSRNVNSGKSIKDQNYMTVVHQKNLLIRDINELKDLIQKAQKSYYYAIKKKDSLYKKVRKTRNEKESCDND